MNKGWEGMGEIHPGMNFLRSGCFKMHKTQNLVSGTCSFVHTLILLLIHSSIQQKMNVCWSHAPCWVLEMEEPINTILTIKNLQSGVRKEGMDTYKCNISERGF